MLLASKAVTLNLEDTVGRASLDLATLGLKGRFQISLSVLSCRSGFCFRRSIVVSAKMAGMARHALRPRGTELLGQLLGRIRLAVIVAPISR